MIRPPRGNWAFIIRMACWVHRKTLVRLVASRLCHCCKVTSSSGTSGPC